MTTGNKISRGLAEAVLRLERLGETRHWDTFAIVGKKRRSNVFRHLKRRGWIEDAAEDQRRAYIDAYTPDQEAPWIAVPSRWRLTESGREAAALARERYEYK